MNTPSALDSLLLAKMLKITPPFNANYCEFWNWEYVQSAKPPGYNLMMFAQQFSGMVYWLASLFGYANEIGLVLIAVQKIGKTQRVRTFD